MAATHVKSRNIEDGSVDTVDLKNDAVTLAKLGALSSKGDLIVHDGTDHVALSAGDDGQILTADSGADEGVSWGVNHGRKNLIINGNFDIWQRGTSFSNSGALSVYTADRWVLNVSQASFTLNAARDTSTPSVNAPFSLKVTCPTADGTVATTDFLSVRHILEGPWLRAIAGRTFTLSFWVKSSKTGTYCLDLFGGGHFFTHEYTISAANTWEKKTITLTHDASGSWTYTAGSAGMNLAWALQSGSSWHGTADAWGTSTVLATANQVNWADTDGATFYLAAVQLEVGAVATSFETIPYDQTLRSCQRYYHTITASAAFTLATAFSTALLASEVKFPVAMCKTPTVSLLSFAGTAGKVSAYTNTLDVGTTVTAATINNQGFAAAVDSGSGFTTGNLYWFGYAADAEL